MQMWKQRLIAGTLSAVVLTGAIPVASADNSGTEDSVPMDSIADSTSTQPLVSTEEVKPTVSWTELTPANETELSMPWTEITDNAIEKIDELGNTVGVYSVASAKELSQALESIETKQEIDVEIQLTSSIMMKDDNFGVSGKHITVTSSGDSLYTLSAPSGSENIYLIGDTTFKNVEIDATNLFAQGHTMEFGEDYTGTGLRLYGGSDKDLDLTENGDEDGSTHIIIRNGKFHSIVGGNKDTFDQGKYHEYADWSNPETNKHSRLTGDIKIDIYGGSWGGQYNIDVGDTCCNTNVTPARLYGGGLGSDTIGDVTINVYDMDYANGYNDSIVGGGFGMAGDEDDQTLYVDKIKHTGVVDGDVNLNLLGGEVAEFYGGGYHGGSAYKQSQNVTSERTQQLQYHREKVAVVTGDVNIVMGGTMTLCQNTAQAWGGSFASTIEGDVNVTIKDDAKLAAKYSLNKGGAPTPNSMNELVKIYKQYYDGSWDNGFYGAGQYDIVGGSVNIDIEGGYIWELHGTTWTDPFIDLPVENTEIQNKNNAPAGVNINVSGGMVQKIWGDYTGGKVADGIAVNMSGGEVFSLSAYDGRNSTLDSGSHVDVDMTGGTVYALSGNYYEMPTGVEASLTLNSTDTQGTLYIGYMEGFHSVTVEQNANVCIDAVPVIREIFEMPEGSYGEDADVPFYRNVFDLNIEKGAMLTTCKNATNLMGNLTDQDGTWIAYGKTVIAGNADCDNGMIFFKEPALIQENAAWNNTLLCLPVVQSGTNYDGTANTDIDLTVKGQSEGTAYVRTVDSGDYTKLITPALGDNYVLSAKNGDVPAQSVYLLENENAVQDGMYLKRVDDLSGTANYMWQVAKATQYILTYESNGGTTFEAKKYNAGTTVTLDKVPVRDGYTFEGWYADEQLTQPVNQVVMDMSKTVYAKWEKDSAGGDGGAHHPEVNPEPEPKPEEPEEVPEEEIPLAETPWLNTDDHYAYIIGYAEDGTVRPNANITRAEVATIFFRLLTDEARDQFWSTSNNFTDVASDAWYNNAVSTMVNAGIIQGYEDGTFRPNNNITRAEFAAIASRFMSSGYDVEEDLFTDIANHWARESINDAAMAKWINGYPDGTFLPDKEITRAEAVTLVNNVLQRKPDADHMLDSMIKWPDNPESAWYYEAIQEATNSHDYDLFEGAEYETWTALQENRDWAALEKDWLNAHRTGGEVM